MSPWYQLTVEDVLRRLASDANAGLGATESQRRLVEYGPNEIEAAHRVSPWTIFLEQFKNVLILILLFAVTLSAFLGHTVEAIAIAVIVLFAVLLGFYQEYRAERAIDALRQMAAPNATVIRDGSETDIPARELVPGDIVILNTGNKVPADARVLIAMNMRVDEAPLTGESLPIEKQTEAILQNDLPVGDRRNMVHAGTAVTYGRGRAVVIATGRRTEFGQIAQLLESVQTSRTPLQINLDKVGRILAQAAGVIVVMIVILGILRGQPLLELLIFGIALAVAVVPEALPAVVTISLAIGVQRMVNRNALVRRLPAVETLGSVSVICSDKTGTLTKDEMTVRKLFVGGQMLEVSGTGYEPHGSFSRDGATIDPSGPLMTLLTAAALASDAALLRRHSDGDSGAASAQVWEIKGDPTEGALVVAAAKAGLDKTALEKRFPRVHEIPFTSESKRMTTLHSAEGGSIAYAKGAPEIVLLSCTKQMTDTGETRLDGTAQKLILDAAQQMASEALRVLAIAYKPNAAPPDAEQEMTFLGLAGMIDPPRPEAQTSIRTCGQAGIKPVMITGDHPLTAQAIARELGVLKHGRAITGVQLAALSDAELTAQVEDIEVFARVSPADKLRVVTALQGNRHIVAMTGDGVNDAPALKKADIGIAMGITGTDVSKEAAAMTLLDDNFASIVAAVEEGRGVFENIKKYLMFLISSNIGEIGLMIGAAVFGLPLPLSAVQILYVNLATDGLPALALAVDPPERDLMQRPPRDSRTGIFTRPVVTLMVVGGLWSALINIGLFSWALSARSDVTEAMTMTFVSLVLIEFLKAYCFRSERHSVLTQPFANKWLNRAIAWEIALLMAVIYAPLLQQPFGTFGLPIIDWAIVLSGAITILPVLEFAKWLVRRGWFGALELT
ncbi:MAG TPA: cation-translocating P-type ATPase [Candidatus Binatia bacterium]|nr:cation-translocating P-type ATPase [Candidatus Binatia bacterium]